MIKLQIILIYITVLPLVRFSGDYLPLYPYLRGTTVVGKIILVYGAKHACTYAYPDWKLTPYTSSPRGVGRA